MANTQNNKKTNRVSIGDTAEIKIKRTSEPALTSSKKPAQQTRRPTTAQSTRPTAAQPQRNLASQPQRKPASQPQRKPASQTSRKKKKSSDAKAKTFLFVMLIAIAVFVAVVCITGADNDMLSTSDTTQTSANAQTSETNGTTSADVPVQGTVADGNNEQDQDEVQDNKPSFYNPATVTDCNFATVVVNRNYRIPESYEDTLELTYVCGSNQMLQKDVAVHYEAMYNAALEDGIYLTPCSGYRSYETQTELYNNKVNQKLNEGYSEEEAPIQAATIVMVPGSSEHNLGYAMDIVCVDEWFEDTAEFDWLMENAEDYGFILRYPEDKQDITMVIYEPWHWRYVGVEAAKEINASGLTLEEYYGKSAQ